MTRSLLALCAFPSLFATLAPAQHQHFEGFKWRERQTDHFTMRSSGTSHDPASRYAEKVWDECLRIMPGLEEDFAQNKFRTPGGPIVVSNALIPLRRGGLQASLIWTLGLDLNF